MIDKGYIESAHDISLGGLITAVSKMCIKGNKGIELYKSKNFINEIEYYFAEDQGRYLIEINPKSLNEVTSILNKNSVHFDDLGIIDENNLSFNGELNLPIEDLTKTHKYWLKGYMEN